MSSGQTQLLIVAIIATFFALSVLRLARRQKLSFRYTAGWLFLLAVSILAGLLIPIVEPIADVLNLSPVAVLVGISITILLAVCIQLSISISGLQKQVRILAEELALIRATGDDRK